MINTGELYIRSGEEAAILPSRPQATVVYKSASQRPSRQTPWLRQMLRFSLVGGLNTLIDLLALNCLLWLFPTTNPFTLLAYNVLAFSLGALNSFLLNKYWTFQRKQRTTWRELIRFALVTLVGVVWSSCILWLASTALQTNSWFVQPTHALLWANLSKVIAIASSALISYLVMRLWVFVRTPSREHHMDEVVRVGQSTSLPSRSTTPPLRVPSTPSNYWTYEDDRACSHSISVVLPVYNEEDAIANTIAQVFSLLPSMSTDFEVIAIDDGSTDRTAAILASLSLQLSRLSVITHAYNQGYGAALADGFAAASKELTFFMDSDGQFEIEDLYSLLAEIDTHDAVIGYRLQRQDTTMRKLNAWGWRTLIGLSLGVHVRDIDCAFKLFRTTFLHQYAPQTRGAMINAELLHKLTCAGYTLQEVGVNHLPRRSGKATGAHPRVIIRAFRELFYYTRYWHRQGTQPSDASQKTNRSA